MKRLGLAKPHVIIMVGIPGSGKSFFAEKFADTFHAPLVSEEKLALLSDKVDVTDLVDHQLSELLKTGQSILLEAGANTRPERQELSKKVHAAGYETLLVWVQTDAATAKARATKVSKDETRRIYSADEYDKRVKRFTPPTTSEKPVVISGRHTYASQVRTVLKRLSAPRAEISTHSAPPIRSEVTGKRSITIR